MFFLLGPLIIQEKIEEKLMVWMGAHFIGKASGFSWNTQKTNTYIVIFSGPLEPQQNKSTEVSVPGKCAQGS